MKKTGFTNAIMILAVIALSFIQAKANGPASSDPIHPPSNVPENVSSNPDDALVLSLALITNVSCYGGNNGLAVVAAVGGLPPFVYLWSNGKVGPINANLTAGVYAVTCTDLLGGTATLNITVDQPPQLNLDIAAQVNIDCIHVAGSATLNTSGGTGASSVLWSNGQVGLTANNLSAGLYTAIVTDGNGCTSARTVNVQANVTLPDVHINTGVGVDLQVDCLTPQITLNGSASSSGSNYTYLWTTANGNIVSGADQNSAVINAAGTYKLRVSNTDNGCTNTQTVNATANLTLPIVHVDAGVGVDLQLDCLTPQISLSGNGSATGNGILYLWTTANGHILSGANTLNAAVDLAGNYTLRVTNNNNGCSDTEDVNVTANLELPTVNIDAGVGVDLQLDCLTPQITLDATASATLGTLGYLWATLGGHIVSGGNTTHPVVDAAGNYTLLVTNNGNGCTSTATVNVTADIQLPIASAIINGQLGCNNSTLTINALASSQGSGFIYLWTTVNGNIVAGANSLTPTVNAAGTYNLLVTNTENGCTASTTVVVTGVPSLSVTLGTLVNVSCFGSLNGSINLNVSGGAGGYSYLWSNGMVNANISGLGAGTYTVTVQDNQNCQAIVNVNIGQPSQINATPGSTPTSGAGANDGSAWVTVTGGTAPYTYSWSNGMSGQSATGLAAGSYTVVVTDAHGCTVSVVIIVGNGANCALNVVISSQNATCGQSNGQASIVVSGANGNLSYLWSNGMTSGNITGLVAGTYVLTVTDAQGCTAIGAAVITSVDNTPPVVITHPVTVELDASGQGILTPAMVNNGSLDACGTIQIKVDVTSFDCSMIGTHIVIFTATDQSGNTATATAMVTVVDNIPPQMTCPDNMTVTGCNGAVSYDMPTLTDNCSLGNFNFMLTGGLSSGSVFPAGITTVSFAAVSANAAISTCSFTVDVANTGLDIGFNVTGPGCPGETNGSISANVSGGSGNYTYLWVSPANQSGPTVSGLGAGVYTLIVADDAGCVGLQSVTVNNPTAISVDLVVITDDCTGEGSLDVTVTGGQAPYTFVWMDANGNVIGTTEDLDNIPSGDYTLMITDANGCTYFTGAINLDLVTGVVNTELESFGIIAAYPNPTPDGLVTLSFNLPQASAVSVEVRNNQGQLISTLPQVSLQQGVLPINLSSATPGLYFINVMVGNKMYTKKVIYLD